MAVSLIEKIAASFTTEWLTDDEKRTLAQAALTAIMGEGDGVQQCDIDLVQQILLRHSHSDFDAYGEAARHRSTAAAAERTRIVAWLEKWITGTMGADMDPKWMIDAIERSEV